MESRKREYAARQRCIAEKKKKEDEQETVREYKAMQEEYFLSSWLGEDSVGAKKVEWTEIEGQGGGKQEWKKEEETVVVKNKVCQLLFQ